MDTMFPGQRVVRELFRDAAHRPTGVLVHGILSRVRPFSSAVPHLSESSARAFGIASIPFDAEHAPWSFLALSKHVFGKRSQQVRRLLFRHAFEWCRMQREEGLINESLSNPKSSRCRKRCSIGRTDLLPRRRVRKGPTQQARPSLCRATQVALHVRVRVREWLRCAEDNARWVFQRRLACWEQFE